MAESERELTLGELIFADGRLVMQCPACGRESRMRALFVPVPSGFAVSRCGAHLTCPACGAKGLITRSEPIEERS